MFPSAWGPVFKLHEVGKYYTTIGFGSILAYPVYTHTH